MGWLRVSLSALVLLALTTPSVRADDVCITDEAQAESKKWRDDAVKAEKTGKPAEMFLAYWIVLRDECMRDKNIEAKYRAALPKLGRGLAKTAEGKGVLYSKGSAIDTTGYFRINENASAFAWFEAIQDYNEANRVMLKALRAKADHLEFFKIAWDVDRDRYASYDRVTGKREPYASPAAYRQELQKIASANAERLMKAEEKDAAGLSGSATAVATSTMSSLDKLKKASEWMKFLPGGDQSARTRAEQRGDTILKRSDPAFTRGSARGYYEFAGTSKAREKLAQLDAKLEASERALEKSAKSVEGAITEKSAAEQKKFQKGKADLEKELGF